MGWASMKRSLFVELCRLARLILEVSFNSIYISCKFEMFRVDIVDYVFEFKGRFELSLFDFEKKFDLNKSRTNLIQVNLSLSSN